MAPIEAGTFRNGQPYNRAGEGSRTLLVFTGLWKSNEPLAGAMARAAVAPYAGLNGYTTYVVNRRRRLPDGYSIEEMADDYAEVVQDDLGGGPVDVVGASMGGLVAQSFALRHPGLVRRLVLHSTAGALEEAGRRHLRRLEDLSRRGRWGAVTAETIDFMLLPQAGAGRILSRPVAWGARLVCGLAVRAPSCTTDFGVTIDALAGADLRGRLGELAVPVLLIAGDRDPVFTPELLRETAAAIPGARLVLLPGAKHSPGGAAVREAIAAFLVAADASASSEPGVAEAVS